jgi:hypothetical protein
MESFATSTHSVKSNALDSTLSAQALVDAMAFSAVVARNDAKERVLDLKMRCQAFVAGQNKDYELVSCCAHLAAGSLRAYGEMCIELNILPEAATDRILAAAYAVKGRAFEHELAHRQNKLEPSQIFYDDMISMSIFYGVHTPIDVERFESSVVFATTHESEKQEAAHAN